MGIRVLLLSLGLASLVLSVTPPANAAREVRTDPRGDAPASVDIRQVWYGNTLDSVYEIVRVRDLKPSANVYLYVAGKRDRYKYAARTWKRGLDVQTRLYELAVEGPPVPIPCRVASRWFGAEDAVEVSFPWRCLDMRRGELSMRAFAIRDQDRREAERFDLARPAVVARG